MKFGVDTGGTFTDVVARTSEGTLLVHKTLSTPRDPSEAIARGVEALRGAEPIAMVHGTTVATNALLERKGAYTALVTTLGFEDLLALGRQNRPDLYALNIHKTPPLIPREDCFGVRERVLFDGRVDTPLLDAEIARLCDRIAQGGASGRPYEAVAICLLHAYISPEHEERLAAALRARLPGVFVTASSEIVREFREFERASTTSVNAFVGPVMSRYLERLTERVDASPLEIFESSGARAPIARVSRLPVHTVLSGPAGGVVGALSVARELGIARIITFDMGGTSTDVALCDGELTYSEVAQIGQLPLLVPMLDIYTVGAGGGSIAHLDEGGALKVGPRSAGAKPGPACYALGGTAPTVTDAHLALGRLREDRFLGGEMTLSRAAASGAIAPLAAALSMSVEEVAAGILRVADAAMVRAIKVISLERGHDPRDFALVSFGGAGGLHACRMAEALGMRRVIIPRAPGLLSAHGMLHAARVQHDALTFVSRGELFMSDEEQARARDAAHELVMRSREAMGGEVGDVTHELSVDLRYTGQSFAIRCEVDWALDSEEDRWSLPIALFEDRHEELYGWRATGREVELVALRLITRAGGGEAGARGLRPRAPASPPPAPASLPGEEDDVFFSRQRRRAQVLDREVLAEGRSIEGPCVITEYSGTAVIPPGWEVEVRQGHLLATRVDDEVEG